MFNDLLSDSANIILVSRLSRVLPILSAANYPTLEEYQSAIYNAVNKILALQSTMQPLTNIKGETPALIGDLTSNIGNLNNDAVDIVSQLSSVEQDAANLFNLGEAAQTTIRQAIREQIYASSPNVYIESFINNNQIQTNTTTLDYISGSSYLPLLNQTSLAFTTSIGTSSVGSSSSSVVNINDGAVDTTYVWNGTTVELILSFSNPSIVNRLVIDLDTYDGLEITTLTSSPDGTVYNDILGLLGVPFISLDASSGKYSGSVIIDFPPQYSQDIQIIINNVVGLQNISLRNVSLYARQYTTSGQLTSTLIQNPIGNVTFSTEQLTTDLTNIVHQFSYDNVHFNVIAPGALTLNQPYWYRALLSRSSKANTANGLIADPANSTYYQIVNSSTVNLGSNITERTIVLSNVTGPIVLSENPLSKSLKVQVNSTFLNSNQYIFIDNVITLNSNQSNVTIIYQTAGVNAQVLATLQNYDTPILTQVTFEA